MRIALNILFLLFLPFVTFSQVAENSYRLYLTDKNNNEFSISNPEEYLSAKATQRRTNQYISITENDLPISNYYLDSLKSLGLEILIKSKWLNTVVVYTTDYELIDTITKYGFIKSKYKSFSHSTTELQIDLYKTTSSNLEFSSNDYFDYGYGTTQISMINGHALHQNNYQGQGITIAVIDGGFFDVDILPAFDSLWYNSQILGSKDFVDGDEQVYDASDHGMKVLSTMGANMPGELVGTAPKANYWLLRSEKTEDENTLEEDNWVAAAEFADSVGADIITSSLGYSEFDDKTQNYTYSDMDGNSTHITKGADIAASKGILVVSSAGNSGNDAWKYITAPGDGDSVLTVGAVDSYASLASFSGQGPTYDGRIKPNICAMGYQTSVQGVDGNITVANGTSFSAPIIAGMAACLWQKNPESTNMDIIRKIEESAHQYSDPDNLMGYGIPDFAKAAELQSSSSNSIIKDEAFVKSYPNPFIDNLNIEFVINHNETIIIDLYNSTGVKILVKNFKAAPPISTIGLNNLGDLPTGIYFMKIRIGNQQIVKTLSKVK
jgi:subtilisin family serine protease